MSKCYIEIEVETSVDVTPRQDGGMTDPSWPAYLTLAGVKLNGEDIMHLLDDKQQSNLLEQTEEDLNDAAAEFAAEEAKERQRDLAMGGL